MSTDPMVNPKMAQAIRNMHLRYGPLPAPTLENIQTTLSAFLIDLASPDYKVPAWMRLRVDGRSGAQVTSSTSRLKLERK